MPTQKNTLKNKSQRPVFNILIRMDNASDVLFVPFFQPPSELDLEKLQFPDDLSGCIAAALRLGDFKAAPGTSLSIPGTKKLKRIVLLGLGKREPFDLDVIRWAGALAAKEAKRVKAKKITIHYGQLSTMHWPESAAALVEGFLLGGFAFVDYKSSKTDETEELSSPLTLQVNLLTKPELNAAVRRQVAEKIAIATATNYARRVACEPGNVIAPNAMIAVARDLARQSKLKFRLIDARQAQKLGMGGLCAVGQGSTQPPGLVFLEYLPPGRAGRKLKTFAITGKAVTFDTGGISIKPAADMGTMKYDKCGGTVVLGVLKAAAELKLPHHIIGVIPIAENSVGSRAYRPGDIIRMYNGKTVDVSNTDAEGRLILADAMAYTCEKFQPDILIDLATLTGGVIVALGSVFAGLFSSDDKLASDLIAAGQQTGEWLWRLPLHERYRKLLDAPHADISNSGAREAHPIQGGMFLREFVPAKIKWAHLDIAGVANQKKDFRYWR
ncbi:MAG TPA: leucyl aminopeptidase, partial [Phycisphaerae bacterium]|nr:leucyl aminopeptidase [Phycisphaerae bacterium]